MAKTYLNNNKLNRSNAKRFTQRIAYEINTTWDNAVLHDRKAEIYELIINPLMHRLMDIHNEFVQEEAATYELYQ